MNSLSQGLGYSCHSLYNPLGYTLKPFFNLPPEVRNIQNYSLCHSCLLRLIKSIKYSLHLKVIPSEVWGNNVIDLRIFLPITSMSMCEDYILSHLFNAFFVFAFFPSDNKLSWTHFSILSTVFLLHIDASYSSCWFIFLFNFFPRSCRMCF